MEDAGDMCSELEQTPRKYQSTVPNTFKLIISLHAFTATGRIGVIFRKHRRYNFGYEQCRREGESLTPNRCPISEPLPDVMKVLRHHRLFVAT